MAAATTTFAGDLLAKVNELIPERDRSAVFDALKRYQSSMELQRLVEDLKIILDEPAKLEIFEYIRPLIPPKHQVDYDKFAPAPPGRKLRSITLRRHGNESLGFAVRGGFEHGIGIFVSQVDTGSQAESKGLKVGDEIVRVNGFTIAEAIHDEVLNLIKGRDEIELKVTNIGMLPIKEKATDPVTWSYVDKKDSRKTGRKLGETAPAQKTSSTEDVKLFVNLRSAPSLGCSILSGPRHFPGIFVERVKPGSLGEEIGIEVGDQIMDVNGTSFQDITHREAVVALKSSKELNIVIRKGTGLPLVQRATSTDTSHQGVSTHVPQHPVEVHAPPTTPPLSEESVLVTRIDYDFKDLKNFPVDKEEDLIAAELRRQESLQRKFIIHRHVQFKEDQVITESHTHKGTKLEVHHKDLIIEQEEYTEQLNTEMDEGNMEEEVGQILEEERREEIRQEAEEKERMEEIRRQIMEEERKEQIRRGAEESKRKEEEKEKERLKKVVAEKLEKQRQEAEELRQEMFEANKRKRQWMERELLRKISLHHREGEREQLLRFQRQKQDQEEMLREGAMSGLVHSIINMWRPHSESQSGIQQPVQKKGILAGKGGPLKKQKFSLLGGTANDDKGNKNSTAKYVKHTSHRKEGGADWLPTPDEEINSTSMALPTSDLDFLIHEDVSIFSTQRTVATDSSSSLDERETS